jgi:hypothetical protein
MSSPARKPHNISALVGRMIGMLAKTDKSTLDDIADIVDDSDVSHGDQWQSGYRMPNQAENPIGPGEAAAGGTATDRWTKDYMDSSAASVSRNSESPTAVLGRMVSQMDRLEKALTALAGFVFKADATDEERFPDEQDAAETKSSKEDEDSEDETSKAGGAPVEKMDLASAFSFLGPQSKLSKLAKHAAAKAEKREAAARVSRGVSTPPSMHRTTGGAIAKAAHQIVADTLDSDARIPFAEAINMRVRANARRMMAEGAIIDPCDKRLTVYNPNSIG